MLTFNAVMSTITSLIEVKKRRRSPPLLFKNDAVLCQYWLLELALDDKKIKQQVRKPAVLLVAGGRFELWFCAERVRIVGVPSAKP